MKRTEKILSFVKRNAFYMVLALCIVAVGVSVVLMLANEPDGSLGTGDNTPSIEEPVDDPSDTPSDPVDKPSDTPSDPVDKPSDTPSDPVDKPSDTPDTPVDKPIVFDMPVKDVTSIGEFSQTMVFNSTLGRFSTHKAIDFFAVEGTDVFAVYEGTIADVQTTLLKGTTITIDHGNGLKTVYNSLADGDSVTVGQKVNKGDVIGQVSSSNRQEAASGAHLHFEVVENDTVIDPAKYLLIEEK